MLVIVGHIVRTEEVKRKADDGVKLFPGSRLWIEALQWTQNFKLFTEKSTGLVM